MPRIPRKPTPEVEDDFTPPTSAKDARLAAMLKLSQGFKAWKPASQVLTPVRSVKTILIQLNRATRVGGYPIERFGVVHGPSSHGKTTLVNAIGLSFLKLGHLYGLIDAERTTPITWLEEMMGEFAHNPGFLAMRPDSYEQTVDAVEEFLQGVSDARDAEELSEDTSAFVAVDSLKKLMPKDIMAKLLKTDADAAKGSVDGMGGRTAQVQAALNTAWMNRLTPLLEKTRTAILAIARESENIGRDPWDPEYKVQGGGAIIYDSSLVMRVLRAGYVRDGKEGPVYGERHRVIVHKTKIAKKEQKGAVCYFHTSNGVLIPAGFDRARDLLELAKGYNVVDSKGSWLTWRSCRWQGDHMAVKKLTESANAFDMLTKDVEARFDPDEALPTESDADNVEAPL